MNDPIIDVHHHIWRVAKVPWLNGPQLPRVFGDYGALRRDYPIDWDSVLPAHYATISRPRFCTRWSSLSAVPVGRF